MRRIDVNASHATAVIHEPWLCLEEGATAADILMAADDGLRSVLVATPGDFGSIAAGLEAVRAAGGPAAICIRRADYPLEPWALSPIPELADREQCCLIVDLWGGPPAEAWSALVRFAAEYPGLPMLAVGLSLDSALAPKALDLRPNIVLEARASEALAALCASHGAYRFAYGSGGEGGAIPELEPGSLEWVMSRTATQLGNGTWGATHL